MKTQTIRSFIAIPLPHPVKLSIDEYLNELKKRQKSGIRWVDAAKMHLTLKFLGDIDEEQIPAIHQAMQAAAITCPAFSLSLKGLGAFPGSYKPRVIWVGVKAPAMLQALHQQLAANLCALGFEAEDRRYSPHLTLGRISRHASEAEVSGVSKLLHNPPKLHLQGVSVDSLNLYRSDLLPGGSVYTLLQEARLKENSSQP